MTDRLLPSYNSVLFMGLKWLFHIEQPDGALISHHGVTLGADNNRRYSFTPYGYDNHPVVVASVADVKYIDRKEFREFTNPIAPDELDQLSADLTAMGFGVAKTWNGHPGITGSVGLKQTAHPTLLAAVGNYQAGCQQHPGKSVFCDCGWRDAGDNLIITPRITDAGHIEFRAGRD